MGAIRNIFTPAGREVVQDGDLMVVRKKTFGHM
jgi:hypothetical protein